MAAAYNGHKEIVSCLIEANADLSIQDTQDRTAFDFAIEYSPAAGTEMGEQITEQLSPQGRTRTQSQEG